MPTRKRYPAGTVLDCSGENYSRNSSIANIKNIIRVIVIESFLPISLINSFDIIKKY
jgi:hypothetical protein